MRNWRDRNQMINNNIELEETTTIGKVLYDYQQTDTDKILKRIKECPPDYHLVYQLPTGGGKTVMFSEIARQFIEDTNKKVLILTHRIELCVQTSDMLNEFEVKNKIINADVRELDDQNEYNCFVAMVETLNNRMNHDSMVIKDVALVIIDEAHYNSFRKLFKNFKKCFILGVTATPLSSNVNLPMKDSFDELLVGPPIESLVEKGFLARATTYRFDVKLGTLKTGMNGDYTVRSSEELYTSMPMQKKLLEAYEQKAVGKKVLIFNSGIRTSQEVYLMFRHAGYPIQHLDSKYAKKDRKSILKWFRKTPGAVLTSVGILTTGFDEPTVETIILNRATRSLTLYFQMIGRGSRVLPEKESFDIIDLGNNMSRFGAWDAPLDWQKIFTSPQYFIDNIVSDDDIERSFVYEMPEEIKAQFSKSKSIDIDIKAEKERVQELGLKPFTIIEKSIEQHANMCLDNSDDLLGALALSRVLTDDIEDRVRRYSYILTNPTRNFKDWVREEYKRKLRTRISQLS